MQTVLRSATRQVVIDPDGPLVIIGERINPTGSKRLATALVERDWEYVADLARRQVAAGADVLDVNVGVPGADEVALLPEAVRVVSDAVEVPLCLDSANADALAAALKVTPGKALVNSVNGEEGALRDRLPVIREYGAATIGLVLDDEGIPTTAERRLEIAERILERALAVGIPAEDVVIDALVLTVGADSKAGAVTLRTIELVRERCGTNINLGASNVSFGLPDRHLVNQAFLALTAQAGATCFITDPLKLTGTVRSIDLLRGRDRHTKRFLAWYRAQAAAAADAAAKTP